MKYGVRSYLIYSKYTTLNLIAGGWTVTSGLP